MNSLSDIQKIRDALQEKGWLSVEELMNVTKIPADKFNSLLDEMFSQSEIAMKNGKFLLLEKKEERKIEGKTAEEWFNLGLEAKDQEKKVKYYTKTVEINPNDAEAWHNKGDAFKSMKRYDEAIECYDKAVEINPRDTASLEKLLLNDEAMKRHYDKALEIYEEALEMSPNDAEAWNNKGLTFHHKESCDEAIECYDKALEISPNDAKVWYNKGITLCYIGRYNEAIECYDKALEIDPNDAKVWYNKGLSLLYMRRSDEAIRCFDKALEIDPSLDFVRKQKKYAEEDLKKEKEKSRIEGKTAEEWYQEGESHVDSGRYENAIGCFDKAIEMDSEFRKNAFAWNYKGLAFHFLKRYEKAIKCFNKALEINPENEFAERYKKIAEEKLLKEQKRIEEKTAEEWFDLALKEKDPVKKVDYYSKCLELNPKNSAAWYNKGVALDKLERYEKAIECYDKALEINPDFEEAKNNKRIAEEKIRAEKIKKVPTMVEEPGLIIERAIYDPCKRDFIEGHLPRMNEWINHYDPCAYWLAISIQNNTDRAIDKWGVELEFSSALKIKEAKIEGIEIEIPHEAHLNTFKISVPKEFGFVIPKGGSQRAYFKLRAEKPKTTYEISGVFKSKITGEVPIRPKEFKYLCDAGSLRGAILEHPEAALEYLKTQVNYYSPAEVSAIVKGLDIVFEICRMCTSPYPKRADVRSEVEKLKGYLKNVEDKLGQSYNDFELLVREMDAVLFEETVPVNYAEKIKRKCLVFPDDLLAKLQRQSIERGG